MPEPPAELEHAEQRGGQYQVELLLYGQGPEVR